ncbi:MAG: hypothetical protein WAL04_04680 [Acidimicrobiales bacterium]
MITLGCPATQSAASDAGVWRKRQVNLPLSGARGMSLAKVGSDTIVFSGGGAFTCGGGAGNVVTGTCVVVVVEVVVVGFGFGFDVVVTGRVVVVVVAGEVVVVVVEDVAEVVVVVVVVPVVGR